MTHENANRLSQEIENVSNNFEEKPYTGNFKLLKEDFDIDSISTPKHYAQLIESIEEVLREARILFLYSVFNKVCQEESRLYYFDTPFQAGMRYDAVMKKEGSFYLLDEDGDYKEIFASESFVHFVDDLYWELYEENEK